jgi:hypothetical protein
MSTFSFWKPGNIIRYQQNAYTSKTLLQLVKSEIIMLIESIPRKSIENHNRHPTLLIMGCKVSIFHDATSFSFYRIQIFYFK